MSKKVIHVGPAGSGSRLKLINNFLCGVQLASLAKPLDGSRDLDSMKRLLWMRSVTVHAGSPLLKTISQRMTKREYQVNFLLRLLEKDLRYAFEDAKQSGIPLHTVEAPIQLLEQARKLGFGEKDMASVVEQFR